MLLLMPISEVEKQARDFAKKRNWLVILSQALAIVVFPLIEASLYRNMESISNFNWVLAPILIAHASFGIMVYLATRNEAFYFEYRDLGEENQDLKAEIRDLETALSQAEYSREASRYALKALSEFMLVAETGSGLSRGDVIRWLDVLLSGTINLRSETFNFTEDAKHNFAVYKYDEESNRLHKLYRVVDDRIDVENRSWEPGEGHIGLCYLWRETIISPDVTQSTELHRRMTDSDTQDYRSMAVTPIFSLTQHPDDEESVLGVFIATSSRPNQFSRERHESHLLILGHILSLFFKVAGPILDSEEANDRN